MEMKVLIISKDGWELSTEMVMDWLIHYGFTPVRINGDVFEGVQTPFNIALSSDSINVTTNNEHLALGSFFSVWIRRWSNEDNGLWQNNISIGKALIVEIADNQRRDKDTVRDYILQSILDSDPLVLTKPSKTTINKLRALRAAKCIGLEIPETLITNSKKELIEFYIQNKGEIISKDISTALAGNYAGGRCFMYTSKISESILVDLPPRFPTSLFQGYVEKSFEIRSFFFNKKVFSMAIMSQADEQTIVDFRKYRYSKPNRTIPYQLPAIIEDKLTQFMHVLDYQTGSFDLIKTPDGRYVFLEMNPVGQFGMISKPCNYPIEQEIAKFLTNNE